jgi:hypothetical protein
MRFKVKIEIRSSLIKCNIIDKLKSNNNKLEKNINNYLNKFKIVIDFCYKIHPLINNKKIIINL